jgi:phosphoribosylformylglycinamidine cyclo-ligase
VTEEKASSYRDAGVNLDAAADAVDRYRATVESTRIPGVLSDVGGFGGLFALRDAGVSLDDPVLVSATDGVGTKLKLAFALDRHDTIGVDCVAMCVNDVVTTGARPLLFLDYLATGRLQPEQAAAVVEGIAHGCAESGCALIGGETAEMPGFYADGEYDVAGFCVGIAERSALLDPAAVETGDVLIGLASDGFHSNGYSLIRKIVDDHDLDLNAPYDERMDETLGEALLRPTRLYPAVFSALQTEGIDLHAAAHITGGGFYENLPRALGGHGAIVDPETWDVPAVINHICGIGDVATQERYTVFNMGIGMVLVVAPDAASAAIDAALDAGFEAAQIGKVVEDAGVWLKGIDDLP